MPLLEANAAGSLGFIRAQAGRFDDATVWLERALGLSEALEADLLVAKTMVNLGWCYYELGDYERTLSFMKRAEPLTMARGQTGDLRIALQTIGNTHYQLRSLDEADSYYRRALNLARELGQPRATAQLLSNLGFVAIEDGRHDAAESYVLEALRIKNEIGDLGGEQHSIMARSRILQGLGQRDEAEARMRQVIASPHTDAPLLWAARANLASLLVQEGRGAEAEAEFRKAFSIMERSLAQLRKAAHRISFFSSLDRFHDDYVDFLVADDRGAKALEVADQSRARLLREGLQGEKALPDARASSFRKAARALDAVLLAYWLAPERSFLWAVTADTIELLELPGESEIRSRVDAHQARVLRSRDPLREGTEDSAWLYRTLVEPAAGHITPGSRVVVILDGALHQLNPETLVVTTPEPHYWIEDVTLATAPSLALLTNGGGTHPLPRGQGLLVIGDAVPVSDDFPRLEHAASEIQRISEPFDPTDVTVYSGVQAEPAVYRRSEPERFSLIHFAAHARANREIPLESAVILSARDDAYKLYAREIVDVPLHADLVTLSACRSAGSRTFAGEGLVGLAWAFLSSGARNVIAGLWNVEDASTAALMGELYDGLYRGQPPAQALREAKLRLLRSDSAYRKPYYWAPFVVYTQRGAAALQAVDSQVAATQ